MNCDTSKSNNKENVYFPATYSNLKNSGISSGRERPVMPLKCRQRSDILLLAGIRRGWSGGAMVLGKLPVPRASYLYGVE